MKYLGLLCLAAVLAMCIIPFFSDGNKTQNAAETKSMTESINEQVANEPHILSVIGVYVVNDGAHEPLYVTVKPDGSAVIAYESNYGKANGQFYGYWQSFNGRSDAAVFTFEDDHYTTPTLRFNFDWDNPKTSLAHFVLADGYMYYDSQAARANNPKLRLEATKI